MEGFPHRKGPYSTQHFVRLTVARLPDGFAINLALPTDFLQLQLKDIRPSTATVTGGNICYIIPLKSLRSTLGSKCYYRYSWSYYPSYQYCANFSWGLLATFGARRGRNLTATTVLSCQEPTTIGLPPSRRNHRLRRHRIVLLMQTKEVYTTLP